jgi:hypothetical protein
MHGTLTCRDGSMWSLSLSLSFSKDYIGGLEHDLVGFIVGFLHFGTLVGLVDGKVVGLFDGL